MKKLLQFVDEILNRFPDDRLTYQKGLPTFHPESADEAARLIGLANEHKQPVYIIGCGNNIDPVGDKFAGLVVIRTDRLNQLVEIRPEDLHVTVGGGYPLREVNRKLAEHSLIMPHAGLPYVGSVGGAIAVNLSGRLGEVDVPLRKYFLKAVIVTPRGEIIKPGSVCFKSVTGYDVVRVFAGSWGLLGLIVSATFRVMPSSGASDFDPWTIQPIDRTALLASLDPANRDADATYSRKIKDKFDPGGVLPIV